MDSQGPQREVGGGHGNGNSGGIPPVSAAEFRAHCTSIPPAPYFPGFAGASSQLPFLYPNSFMPPLRRTGFMAPGHGYPNATIDLTDGSQNQCPEEVVTECPKPTKKRRVAKKKVEIVELDDNKEDVDVQKTGGHWKDHWVIQLISLRGEMQNTFSAPPKQGMPVSFHIFFAISILFLIMPYVFANTCYVCAMAILLHMTGNCPCLFGPHFLFQLGVGDCRPAAV